MGFQGSREKVLVVGSMDGLLMRATDYLDNTGVKVYQSADINFCLRFLQAEEGIGVIIVYDISYFDCLNFMKLLEDKFDHGLSVHVYFTDRWFRIKSQLYQGFQKLNLHFISKNSEPVEVLFRVQQSMRNYYQSLMNKVALKKVLPESVINELARTKTYKPDKLKNISVLFTDFVDFTETSQSLKPRELLNALNFYFMKFDEIVQKYRLEKIKTIGDSYMVISGMNDTSELGALRTALAAIEISQFCQTQRIVRSAIKRPWWDIRIGINTGDIIGGVIGSDKLIFDVFGNNVNLASRLESSAKKTEINISETTHLQINNYISSRPIILSQVKSFGKVNSYKINNIKSKFALSEDNLKPNATLKKIVKLPMTEYELLERMVFSKLHDHLPSRLKYHNKQHTVDVINSVSELGKIEGVSSEELLLLKTAALFHDSGYVFTYEGHEDKSIEIAQNWLPKYNFTDAQIRIICDLIEVTKLGVLPESVLQRIMVDADHSYFGNEELYSEKSEALRVEWNLHGKSYSDYEWFKEQHDYLVNHCYYTDAAKVTNELTKTKIISEVDKILRDLAA